MESIRDKLKFAAMIICYLAVFLTCYNFNELILEGYDVYINQTWEGVIFFFSTWESIFIIWSFRNLYKVLREEFRFK